MKNGNVIFLLNTPSPALRGTLSLRGRGKQRGFTLTELLVVVLIIGILAAVAVPQYQKAVYKSKFATLKPITESLAQAQEIYYLANGKYTDKIADLDIDIPEATDTDRSSDHLYRYSWGYCAISLHTAQCKSDATRMQYQIYLQHSTVPARNSRRCLVWSTQDLNDIPNQVCKSETNAETGEKYSSGNYTEWIYQ